MEQWRRVPGWPSYQVSDIGRVRRHPPARQSRDPDGVLRPTVRRYTTVRLHGTRRAECGVHRLMALAFLGPPPTPKHVAAHWDGDAHHNVIANIRWATHAENHADRERHGRTARGSKNGRSKLTEDDVRAIRASTAAASHLTSRYGVSKSLIQAIRSREVWRSVA